MKFSLDSNASTYTIKSYSEGKIKIGDQEFSNNILVTEGEIIDNWGPANFAELALEDLEILKSFSPEVVLLGTGKQFGFLSPLISVNFAQANIGIEVMDTAAACRTYNILLSEGRRVAAALFMI